MKTTFFILKKMYIAIAGNIGSETTLTSKLKKHFSWEAHYEDVENNPYLNDFYKDCKDGLLIYKYIF